MIQDILDKITLSSTKFSKIKKQLEKSKTVYLTGFTNSAKRFFASYIINTLNRPILIITPDITTALKYNLDIQTLTNKKVNYLPNQEASPYELVYSDAAITKQQLNILESFKNDNSDVIITSAKSLLNAYLSRKEIEINSIKLERQQNIDPSLIIKKLIDIGYNRVNMAIDPGEFSLRGDILDVYPISEDPVRIEFFGDEIENIRNFDIETQRSIKYIQYATIEPRYKIVISEDQKKRLIKIINEFKNKQEINLSEYGQNTLNLTVENILTSLETETYFEGIEYFAPFLNEKLDDITEYLPENTLIIVHETTELEQKLYIQDEKYKKEYEQRINEGLALPLPYFLHKDSIEIIDKIQKHTTLNLNSFIQDESQLTDEIECKLVQKFMANLDNAANYISELRSSGNSTLVVTEYPDRVAHFLAEWECPSIYLEPNSDINIDKLLESKEVIISRQGFTEGFLLPELNFAVITDSELFNKNIKKPTIAKRVSKRENIDFLISINDLQPNDYVVHSKHGIGKFIGLSKQKIDGQEKDYLTIEYAGTDKLHMPAEQINLLSRYRGAGTPPKLSKMGGAEWTGVKKKVKNSIRDIAQDLLNLYATRAKTRGFVFEPDSPWQIEMEDAFPYTETPDQLQAIINTKMDMESDKPMDRLICGDVGFGKTEVAMRALFKALLSGRQAALLAPTTILAQQHYQTFVDRFKPYPIKVELLSRFRTPKQQKETIKKLITGECDLVIGTHRLLQKDIQFKDLGLLVIDEEHRFGVAHKEKLKHLRAQIDVLTLSATPIPRTLYMAISGVRDMSLINTPPVNRAPIKTYIGEYTASMIRTAINHELEREGQVYFLHNRVQSIHKVAKDLQELIPEARIAVAHGQMPEKELEKVMYEFSTHQYDILVCTTIIESGLDIPNVNTIIIDDSDKFGLAQLYQIRGRVGRSETQAYAYCFYRPNKLLTKEAKDRLKAIKDFTTLGSGYQIALRDLEIRGVGNILGANQHGHMLSVGFDLYCSLLDESIREFQNEKVDKKDPPIVDINITAYIPDEWVGNQDQKMIEYKRLADVESLRELELIQEEWKDRFGEIPIEVQRLIKIIKIRLIAAQIGINLVRESEDTIRIFTDYELSEWKKYQIKLPQTLSRKLKIIKAPISSQNGASIILLNNTGLLVEEQLNILEELFCCISDINKLSI
ncbi:MAG: transcription-repair coupling factor [Candidatus Melainabacteria bacterium GWF2_32_7]|nr:MAG: transcription-repair coupling factor [Candidatus Melainabacteria bacterium GWF2_32_7]